MQFQCNVCGEWETRFSETQLTREAGTCSNCRMTVRERSIFYLLSAHLFGGSMPVIQWPDRKELRVLGISDGAGVARVLAGKFKYENLQFHVAPHFDVKSPSSNYVASANVVVCSDVLEHVAPHIEPAFEGLYSILKPGGLLVFTVPWTRASTVEHFPELNDWRIEGDGQQRALCNTTIDGRKQVFRNLRFHGGVGMTLEMRIFGLVDLIYQFVAAGFHDVRVMTNDVLTNGIRIGSEISRPITCRKP